MKHFILSFSLIFLLFNFSLQGQKTADNPNDTTYTLKLEKPSFMISFPGEYILEESSENNGLKTELYITMVNDEVYTLKYTEHKNPAISSGNPYYMDASLESFVTGIKGTLSDKKSFKYGKYSGLEAFLTLDDKNMNVFYRVLIIDRVQYQLIVITKSSEKTKMIKNFFNTFICPANS